MLFAGPEMFVARFVIFFAILALLAPSAAQAEIAIGHPEEARLAAGDVLVDVHVDEAQDAANVAAVADIAAKPETVWAVMTDCERAPRFVPDLVSCRVLERDPAGAWDIREHIIDWTWFLPNIRNVFRSDYEAPHRLRFKRVDGDLRLSEGEWRLEPLNGGAATRVYYTAMLSPNSWVPASFALSSVRSDVPKILRALRRECTSAK